MDRPIADGIVPFGQHATMPTTGTRGLYTDGNAASGVPATADVAYMMNSLVEEIRNAIIGSGQTPDGANWAQLAIAICTIGTRQAVFPTTGTFVVPDGVYRIKVRMVGGGGAGGSSSSTSSGAGGGAGGYAEGTFSVTPGVTYIVTVPAAASGGTGTGANGGTVSLGALLSATGGQGGGGVGASFAAGGAPGAGIGSVGFLFYGGHGGDGNLTATTPGSGNGGASAFGGGGRGAASGSGVSGQAPGSGGGGCYGPSVGPGGNGAAGIVLVEY